jgi:hypothetical protein
MFFWAKIYYNLGAQITLNVLFSCLLSVKEFLGAQNMYLARPCNLHIFVTIMLLFISFINVSSCLFKFFARPIILVSLIQAWSKKEL